MTLYRVSVRFWARMDGLVRRIVTEGKVKKCNEYLETQKMWACLWVFLAARILLEQRVF